MAQPADLRLLRTLVAVAREGSVQGAAVALGYSSSAVSRHISDLEKQVNVELSSHQPGIALTLTTVGKHIAAEAINLLAAADDFQRAIQEVSDSIADHRIGAFASAASKVLPQALEQLASEPDANVAFSIREIDPDEGMRALRAAEIDTLIAYHYPSDDPPPYGDSLTVRHIASEPLLLCYSPRIPGMGIDPNFDLVRCQEHPWVSGHPGRPDRQILGQWARRNGIRARVQHETNSHSTALALIATGLAVGLLPASVVHNWNDPQHPIATITPPPGDAYRDVRLIHRLKYESPVASHLATTLIQLYAEFTTSREEGKE